MSDEGVDARALLVDLILSCSPVELELLGEAGRHHAEVCDRRGVVQLGAFWRALAVTADTVRSGHPDLPVWDRVDQVILDGAQVDFEALFGDNDTPPEAPEDV